MKFTDIEVIKTKDNFHYIEWEVKPDILLNESISNYIFHIYYSRDPNSGFAIIYENELPIGIDGATGPLAYIHRIKQYDFNQEHYYKIEAVDKSDQSKVILSNASYIGNNSDGAHETMKYAEETLYSFYSGEPTLIVKKKVLGERCPKCWSSFRGQRIISDCDVCFGSGFKDGYYCPIQIQMAYDANPKKSDLQETSEDVTNFLQCRLSNYPLIRPKDLIINMNSYTRYMVVRVDKTKLPNLSKSKQKLSEENYTLSQIVTVKELNPADPQYNVPLPENVPPLVFEGESMTFDGGNASTTDFIWYIDGNTSLCQDV